MAGFMTGRGAFLVLFINGAKVAALDLESWDLAQDADVFADGVNGEDRDRPGKEIKLYKLSTKMFNASTQKLKTLLQYDQDLDDDAQPAIDFGIKLQDKAGNADLFTLTEGTIDDWKWASGGRTARQMLEVPMRFRYFIPIAA